jgi:hypothetical protein
VATDNTSYMQKIILFFTFYEDDMLLFLRSLDIL